MRLQCSIPFPEIVTEIFIGEGLLKEAEWIECLKSLAKQVAIVTDDHVKDLFGNSCKQKLEEAGIQAYLFSLPSGEKSKTRAWKQIIEDQMFSVGLGRDTALLALGGGVVTDLAGFIAATYCRGIPFISIPTTLLGQVDASIGGKVGINIPHGKNLIGAFYPARFIFLDRQTLCSLPHAEWLNGMAEIIKYALIASLDLFAILQQTSTIADDLILESCLIKKRIVEQDPYERGLRRILNFGHTVGHAIETAMDYTVAHGEAVAIGMAVEAYLSYTLHYLSKQELEALLNLLTNKGFSLSLSSTISNARLIDIMCRDKKASLYQPRFVLLQSIGKVVEFDGAYCGVVNTQNIEEALTWLRSQ